MPEGYLLMSADERERSHLIRRVIEKSLSQGEAADRLGIGVRQIKRLVRAWRRHGDGGLVSRQRGRAAHNRLSETTRLRIEQLLRETYPDFGPTLASEKLAERHGIFRVNAKDAESGDGKTEFGRVVERLGIGLINALTPQAKGRVERANQTLQDRLIKEMRLSNINSIEAAQTFLPGFILKYN